LSWGYDFSQTALDSFATMSTTAPVFETPLTTRSSLRRVVIASSLGAIFESYDLTLFGPLAPIIAAQFFANLDSSGAYVFTLLSFALPYVVRPLGGVIFGSLGDRTGRKYSFLVTITILGTTTVLIGLLPSYATIGITSPILLMALRVCQGMGFGGEFGSAVTYIAEHAQPDRRGLATAAVVITNACGLVLSILVVLATELTIGQGAFERWGWRIPFLLSAALMLISIYMRRQLYESPVFVQLRVEGKLSKAPLREAFATRRYLGRTLLAVCGVIAGSSVAAALGTYPIFFLMLNLKIDPFLLHYTILGYSVLFVLFLIGAASVSDRLGRKPVMVTGFLLTALVCIPIFKAIPHYASPALEAAVAAAPIRVHADPADCTGQIDPIGVRQPRTSCDIALRALAKAAVPYSKVAVPRQLPAQVTVGQVRVVAFDGRGLAEAEYEARARAFAGELTSALASDGYPKHADPGHTRVIALIGLLVLLNLFVALAAGPSAACLVEMFPSRIRDSALSVPYNIGTWFGGFLPTIVFAVFTLTGDFYAGLWYAVAMLVFSSAIATVFLPETRGRSLGAID
jgi:MFS family permease